MVDKLLEEFEHKIDSIRLIPGTGGVYEVDVDGTRVFSKKDLGRHADYDEVAEPIRSMLA
jgi:selenoprotein W-related protein